MHTHVSSGVSAQSEANHGRQDTEASTESQEAEAGHAADQGRVVAQGKARPRTAPAERRFRNRTIELAEGGKLALRGDGAITLTDAAGETVGTWAVGDPDWARHAIRFGLQPQPTTVPPQGRRESDPRPTEG